MKSQGSGRQSKVRGSGRRQAPVATPVPVPAPAPPKPPVGTPVPNIAVAQDKTRPIEGVVREVMVRRTGAGSSRKEPRTMTRFEDGSVAFGTPEEQARRGAANLERVWKQKAAAARVAKAVQQAKGVSKAGAEVGKAVVDRLVRYGKGVQVMSESGKASPKKTKPRSGGGMKKVKA